MSLRLDDKTSYAIQYMARQNGITATAQVSICIGEHFYRKYGCYPTEIEWSSHGYGDPDPETK